MACINVYFNLNMMSDARGYTSLSTYLILISQFLELHYLIWWNIYACLFFQHLLKKKGCTVFG